ncbi:MAG: proprotein convertase P-domain-containing protein [Woeseiaceae bacterium]|nr:proprotein convertase P-domain-containing protein [Woeseiaceae bacterium]
MPLESVEGAWRNLRSFPGHAETADRLYLNLLQNRAAGATAEEQIEALAGFARNLPDSEAFADRLVAGFWDRATERAMRAERRDEAIIAALESLVVATPERRRVAAALLGQDYSQLIATLPARDADRLLFNARDILLTYVEGSQVSQWSLQNDRLVRREPWTISSLEITPLLRRVAVDRQGNVSRIGLSVNVGHARLADLRLKLIAPSGRTVELDFRAERSSANDETRFASAQLEPLLGETLAGTWSLSLQDEAPGVNGHLIGWNLNLNAQVLVENFDRGLDIPAPVERESDSVWFDRDGRYAVARAARSDSARLWDLASAQPARTIAVPADERVIGLGADGRYLVTAARDAVHLWRTVNGRRESVLPTAIAGDEVRISDDGRHLLIVRRGEPETELELWSVETGERVARLGIAGSPALLSIDGGGAAAGRR